MHFILGGKNQGKLNWYLTRNHAANRGCGGWRNDGAGCPARTGSHQPSASLDFPAWFRTPGPVPLLEQYLQEIS